MAIDLSSFEEVFEDDIHSHIYELSGHKLSAKRLGYVDRSSETIEISLPMSKIDMTIVQSLTGLSESTGYVCWETASYLTDWILSDENCPIRLNNDMTVVELGSGVGGILVSQFGPQVKKYVATDQKPILKLLKKNFVNNVRGEYTSETCDGGSSSKDKNYSRRSNGDAAVIEFVECDWEYVEHGVSTVKEVIGDVEIDLVIACDTIYNEYLIPHFIRSFKSLMGANTAVLVGLQVRDEVLMEIFAEKIFEEDLKLYYVRNEYLSSQLLQGYVVYYIERVNP
ncbi:hypothetical protein CLIB1423_13S03422 [[Candida] railenensis]|uniref:Ribosomal lysine N-methyltransferase 5 n=1 Tax=[Candida] railenensis TaxID=45579 RepID=A0A9P0QS64_9ASCO|nr:hypothetical protein CLIB1423_13S03422 [[Candida] railenensis]